MDINFKLIKINNSGVSNARNIGIRESKGKYILPLDSDDMISAEYIQTCVNIIRKDKKISPVYCDTNHVGQMTHRSTYISMDVGPDGFPRYLVHTV